MSCPLAGREARRDAATRLPSVPAPECASGRDLTRSGPARNRYRPLDAPRAACRAHSPDGRHGAAPPRASRPSRCRSRRQPLSMDASRPRTGQIRRGRGLRPTGTARSTHRARHVLPFRRTGGTARRRHAPPVRPADPPDAALPTRRPGGDRPAPARERRDRSLSDPAGDGYRPLGGLRTACPARSGRRTGSVDRRAGRGTVGGCSDDVLAAPAPMTPAQTAVGSASAPSCRWSTRTAAVSSGTVSPSG